MKQFVSGSEVRVVRDDLGPVVDKSTEYAALCLESMPAPRLGDSGKQSVALRHHEIDQ